MIDKKNYFLVVTIIFFSVLLVFNIFYNLHISNFENLSQSALGVLNGKPHWIAYQNRLLGPILILLVSKIGISYTASMIFMFFLLFLIEVFLLFYIFSVFKYSLNKILFLIFSYFILFLFFQDQDWYYIWDSISIITFTLFAYFLVQKKNYKYFIFLFLIEFLNRESILFLIIILIFYSLEFSFRNKYIIKIKYKKIFFVNSFFLLTAAFSIKIIRGLLFIERYNGSDDTHKIIGNHTEFWRYQIHYIFNIYSEHFNILATSLTLIPLIYFIYKFKRLSNEYKCLVFLIAIYLLGVVQFGSFHEYRILQCLIPLYLIVFSNLIRPV